VRKPPLPNVLFHHGFAVLLVKGGPEPSILDDLCLGNVISKYFSKLRFGTSKIQPELKCLENILLSFYESLLRARRWEHELFSVRSIAFISTVVKSPNETCNKYKAFCVWSTRGCYTDEVVSTAIRLDSGVPCSNLLAVQGKEISKIFYIGQFHFCKITRAFWKLRQFSKRVNFQKKARAVLLQRTGSNTKTARSPGSVAATWAIVVQHSQCENMTVCV